MPILIKYWRPLAVLVLLLVVYLTGDHNGDARRDREWSARWHQHVAEDMEQVAKAEAAARDQEQKWVAAFDAAAAISHKELANVHSHRDRLLADLRSGRLRLQACAASQVPGPAADSGESQAGAEGGQPGLVGEELVARLAICDEVTIERNQAVELLRAERR